VAKKQFPKTVTPAGIAAYAYLNKPDTGGKYSDDKYKVDVVIDNDVDLSKVEAACHAAAEMEWGRVPKSLKMPITDGDTKTDKDGNPKEEFQGKMILRAKSQFRPGMVDAQRQPLPDNVWPASGDTIKISVICIPYKAGGQPGVALQLRNVQLLDKANRIGGNAADDFDDEDGYAAEPSSNQTDDDGTQSDVDDF